MLNGSLSHAARPDGRILQISTFTGHTTVRTVVLTINIVISLLEGEGNRLAIRPFTVASACRSSVSPWVGDHG